MAIAEIEPAALPQDIDGWPTSPFYRRDQVIDMNLKFAKAMLKARKQGAERFFIGTFVDERPFGYVTHFPREIVGSLIRSSGALCAENVIGEKPMGWSPMERTLRRTEKT